MKNWRARMRKRVEEFRRLPWFRTVRGKRNLVLLNVVSFGINCFTVGKISSAGDPSVVSIVFLVCMVCMVFMASFTFTLVGMTLRSLIELTRKR